MLVELMSRCINKLPINLGSVHVPRTWCRKIILDFFSENKGKGNIFMFVHSLTPKKNCEKAKTPIDAVIQEIGTEDLRIQFQEHISVHKGFILYKQLQLAGRSRNSG